MKGAISLVIALALVFLLGGCGELPILYSSNMSYSGGAAPDIIERANAATDAAVVGTLSTVLGQPSRAEYDRSATSSSEAEEVHTHRGDAYRYKERHRVRSSIDVQWGDPCWDSLYCY